MRDFTSNFAGEAQFRPKFKVQGIYDAKKKIEIPKKKCKKCTFWTKILKKKSRNFFENAFLGAFGAEKVLKNFEDAKNAKKCNAKKCKKCKKNATMRKI